jgi:hypothetical protein
MVGTAVLRIVVSSDSIKNATAISHGTKRLLEAASGVAGREFRADWAGSFGLGCMASVIAFINRHFATSDYRRSAR